MPIEYYSPMSGGAVSTVIMQRAKHLIARGHQVSVLAVANSDPLYPVGDVIPLAVPVRESLTKPWRALSYFRNRLNHWEWPYYGYYIRSFGQALATLSPTPDVVITHNDFIASRFIKKILPDTPVVSWLHNELYRPAADVAVTAATTDRFIAVSNYVRDWTANTYPILSNKLDALHNGTDLEAFFPADDFLEPAPHLRVLFVGRISKDKGPDLVADAVQQLIREEIPVRFTVAGGVWWHGVDDVADPYFRNLKEKMETAQAEFCGQVARPDVPALMRRHDVVCVVSRFNDPCPLVALEAMGAGCVVLASRRGGLPEICGDAALYADPDHPASVADGLRRLATEPALLRELKQKSVARSINLSWKSHSEQLEAKLQLLLT